MEGIKPKGRGWYRYSEEMRQAIIKDYEAGASILMLAEKYNVMWLTVKTILRKAGISIRRKAGEMIRRNTKLFPKDQLEVVEKYRAGENSNELAEAYGVSQTVISKVIARHGATRDNSDCRKINTLDESVFDTITEESAYWVGFLITDGGIVEGEGHSPAIGIGLQEKDLGHIYKFRDFLKSDHAISHVQYRGKVGELNSFHFHPRSARLAEALARFGVVPRKSHIAKVIGLERDRHFWRGVIDGDGCIFTDETPGTLRLIISGSEDLTSQFREYVLSLSSTCGSEVRPQANIFRLALTGKYAMRVIRELYRDAKVALERKASIARFLMEDPGYADETMESKSALYVSSPEVVNAS